MGVGGWGMGIGGWAQTPNPQPPIPQSPIPNPHKYFLNYKYFYLRFLIFNKIKQINLSLLNINKN